MIVDGTAAQAMACANALGDTRFATTHVASARQLSDQLETVAPPDLLLTDVCSSAFDGFRFLHGIQSHRLWCAVPVIALTTRLTVEQMALWRQLEVPPELLLVKPIEPGKLLHAVERVIERKLPGPLIKGLERARLQLKLTLATEKEASDRAIRAIVQAARQTEEELATARKELRRHTHQAIVMSGEFSLGKIPTSAKRQELETRIDSLRAQTLTDAATHRRAVVRRHESTIRLRREICEIENRVRALQDTLRLEALRKKKTAAAAAQSAEQEATQRATHRHPHGVSHRRKNAAPGA